MIAKTITDFFESLNLSPYGSLINNLISTGIWAFIVFTFYKIFNGAKSLRQKYKDLVKSDDAKKKKLVELSERMVTLNLELPLIFIFLRLLLAFIVLFESILSLLILYFYLCFTFKPTILNLIVLIVIAFLSYWFRKIDGLLDATFEGVFKTYSQSNPEIKDFISSK